MTRIIDIMQNDKKNSKWIVDNFRDDNLYVDDSFQRRYVWLEKHKIKLIETILLGYAIPEIYLWETEIDPDSGQAKYSIVDGQQRIGALFDFIDGKFKLKSGQLSYSNADYANKYFNELSKEEKQYIWGYKFSIRQVPQDVSKQEIVKMFLRLNSTDKSLNPQELRHAEFNGEFLKAAEDIANNEFWERNKIFSLNAIRKMQDIEFISSLLIFLRFGIESEINQKAVNKAYDLFNERYDEKEEDALVTNNILREIQKIIDHSENNIKFVSKTTHLYTLFTLVYYMLCKHMLIDDFIVNNITNFIDIYNNDNIKNDYIIEYKKLSNDATKSKIARLGRLDCLKSYLNI